MKMKVEALFFKNWREISQGECCMIYFYKIIIVQKSIIFKFNL